MNDIPKTVIFDNDECTGRWAEISLLHIYNSSFINLKGEFPPSKLESRLFVKHLIPASARPGLIKVLRLCYRLKSEGKIDLVGMFTAANNVKDPGSIFGWVEFLKMCLEQYARVPGLYNFVFSAEKLTPSGMKNLKRITKDLRNTLMIENYAHGVWPHEATILEVPSYVRAPGVEHVNNYIDDMEKHGFIISPADKLQLIAGYHKSLKTDGKQNRGKHDIATQLMYKKIMEMFGQNKPMAYYPPIIKATDSKSVRLHLDTALTPKIRRPSNASMLKPAELHRSLAHMKYSSLTDILPMLVSEKTITRAVATQYLTQAKKKEIIKSQRSSDAGNRRSVPSRK